MDMLAAGEAIHLTKLHKIWAPCRLVPITIGIWPLVFKYSVEDPSILASWKQRNQFCCWKCVREYHVYQAVWPNPALGEALTCAKERGNRHDIIAVAVHKADSTIVGHVPREILCICNLFIRDGGTLDSSVNGSKHYSHDIPEGGMEILCNYTFSSSAFLTEKTRRHLIELQERYLQSKMLQNVPPALFLCLQWHRKSLWYW